MPLPATSPSRNGVGSHGNYGKGAVHDFDNESKWTTVRGIPVLDEHELTDDNGQVVGHVDRAMLEEIAANNNKRVHETNDPAPLIVGHTSDNPQAPERPVVGYAVNYDVRPYKRDPNDGHWIYAIHADYKVRKNKEHVIEDFPRRSVELWLGRKELDPIALLGGTTPERDLGVIIRKSRITGMTLDKTPSDTTILNLKPTSGSARHYRKNAGAVLRYAMATDDEMETDEDPINYSCEGGMKTPTSKSAKQPGLKTKTQPVKAIFERDDTGLDEPEGVGMQDDQMDALPPGPDGDGGDGYDSDPADEDPAVAAVFQSKQFKSMLQDAIKSALEGLLAEEEGGAGPAGAGAGGPPPMEPDGDEGADPMAGGPPPEGTDGLAPQPDEEARIDHEAPPVRFSGSTNMAGPNNTMEPGFSSKGTMGKHYNRGEAGFVVSYQNHAGKSGTKSFGSIEDAHDFVTNNMSNWTSHSVLGLKNDNPPGSGIHEAEEVTKHSRHNGSNKTMTRTQQPTRPTQNPEVIRLQRQVNDLLIKNARAESREAIQALISNVDQHPEGGIVFADPEAEAAMLAAMDPQSRAIHIDNIKKNYKRQGSVLANDPTNSGPVANVLRYARPQAINPGVNADGSVDADANYEPANGTEATILADAQVGTFTQGKKLSYGEAVRYCRQSGRIGRRR